MKQFIPILLAATEAAAIASKRVVGLGNQLLADQVAVDAMRSVLSGAPFSGTVVIGEGERDAAPMLYIGEKVGGGGTEVDLALDPLEGTGICSSFGDGALSVIACGAKNSFLHAPDVYMQKIAVGKGLPKGVVSLKKPIEENLRNLADAKGVSVSDLTVVILKRSRHEQLIRSVRSVGARIKLISDGDISAILEILLSETCDICVGSGGAPEGVLAAVALKALGGQMECKLLFNDDAQHERACDMGVKDCNKIYSCDDLVKSDDSVLVITGVTDTSLLMSKKPNSINSLVIHKDEVQYLSKLKL